MGSIRGFIEDYNSVLNRLRRLGAKFNGRNKAYSDYSRMFACVVRSDSTALAVDTCTTFIHALRVLLAQVDYLRAQLAKSVAEGARLGQELKRTQESLLFLSAWDEEKIELESEVSGVCGRNDPGPIVVLVFTLELSLYVAVFARK